MFMGGKSKDAADGEGEDEAQTTDEMFEAEDSDDQKAKILVMRDAISRVCCAMPIPRKGLDADGWSLQDSLRLL